MSCRGAITLLESEMAELGHGGKAAPAPCTTNWYLTRGKALAVSFLRSLEAAGLADDPQAVERLYKAALRGGKRGE